MKKNLLLFFVLFLASSCVKEVELNDYRHSEFQQEIVEISKIDYALAKLNEFMDNIDKVETRSSGLSRSISINSVEGIGLEGINTRSLAENNIELPDTVLFLVNFDKDGFAVLSADQSMNTVLAFCEQGKICKEMFSGDYDFTYGSISNTNDIVDPNQRIVFDLISNYIINHYSEAPLSSGVNVTRSGDLQWTVTSSVPAMIKYKWHQKSPFNSSCPLINGERTLAGCGPISVAQLCAYLKYPDTYKNAYINNYGAFVNGEYWLPLASTPRKYVADFVADIGTKMNANYGVKSTGVTFSGAFNCFNNLEFINVTSHSYRGDMVIDRLEASCPIWISGYCSEGGHAWLIDGYVKEAAYVSADNANIYRTYLHCNFGWQGICDGYFFEGIFDTSNRQFTDSNVGDPGFITYPGYYFNTNLMIITYSLPSLYISRYPSETLAFGRTYDFSVNIADFGKYTDFSSPGADWEIINLTTGENVEIESSYKLSMKASFRKQGIYSVRATVGGKGLKDRESLILNFTNTYDNVPRIYHNISDTPQIGTLYEFYTEYIVPENAYNKIVLGINGSINSNSNYTITYNNGNSIGVIFHKAGSYFVTAQVQNKIPSIKITVE